MSWQVDPQQGSQKQEVLRPVPTRRSTSTTDRASVIHANPQIGIQYAIKKI